MKQTPKIGDRRINHVFAWRPRLLERFVWFGWYWVSEECVYSVDVFGNYYRGWIEVHASKYLINLKHPTP